MADLARKIEQVKALENGRGLQFLLDESYSILGNPMVLHDLAYQLMAHTQGVVTDDPLTIELLANKKFSDKTIAMFADERFIDIVAQTKSTALLVSEQLKYDRLYGRIFNQNHSTVADLVMVASERPFENGDELVFEAFRKKLSDEISRDDFFRSYAIAYHESLICQLLSGDDAHDKVIHSDHIANLYEGMKQNIYLAVADIGGAKAEPGRLAALRDLFKEKKPTLIYAVYAGDIVILLSTDGQALDAEKELGELSGFAGCSNFRAGISGCLDNLFILRKYYDQAVCALAAGLESGEEQQVFVYREACGDAG